jgi:hypothetical protein
MRRYGVKRVHQRSWPITVLGGPLERLLYASIDFKVFAVGSLCHGEEMPLWMTTLIDNCMAKQ